MKQWNKIFKKHGKVFLKPQEDMPRIAKLFKRKNIKRVLDLGCGTGRHLIYFAKKGFDIYGIDIAEEGIKIARKWLKGEKLKAKLKIGSIYKELPYKSNFFDAVISTNAIHHGKIKTVRKAIKEVERVLKPKGLIFITVRKRKFKKRWPKSKVIERHGKQTVRYRVIGPRTYVPMEGGEKNLIHYLFNKELIKKEFNNFKLYDIWANSVRMHYCFLGELRNEDEN